MPTVHNGAKISEIAKNVIIAGDPLRVKHIAENFLTDAKLVSSVRNMYAYTGFYNNKPITVMGHGMGMPSLAIYVEELFSVYHVENIIRTGSAGGIGANNNLFDVVIGTNCLTNSNIGKFLGYNKKSVECSLPLFEQVLKTSNFKSDKSIKIGNVFTSDVFYVSNPKIYKKFIKQKCICCEMESYALYALAHLHNKNAISLLTISDIIGEEQKTTVEEREKCFNKMINLALETLTSL